MKNRNITHPEINNTKTTAVDSSNKTKALNALSKVFCFGKPYVSIANVEGNNDYYLALPANNKLTQNDINKVKNSLNHILEAHCQKQRNYQKIIMIDALSQLGHMLFNQDSIKIGT